MTVNHKNTHSIFICLLLLVLFSAEQIIAESHHQHNDNEDFLEFSSHIHDEATANITLVDDSLTVELHLPAINVFGFERQPQNAQEQQIVTDRLKLLGQNHALMQLPSSCYSSNIKILTDIQASDDHHQHDHEINEHSDITATYSYKCKNTNQIELTFILFNSLTSLQKVMVQFVSDNVQNSFTATQESPSITLF